MSDELDEGLRRVVARLREPAGADRDRRGEERHEDLVDDLVLPDDHLPDLGEDALASIRDTFRNCRYIGRRHCRDRIHQCVSE